MSATGASADATLTLSGELATTTDDTGTYKQFQTANIATIDTQRGSSIKEIAAVAQSGMNYDPMTEEMLGGTTRLKALVQRLLLQGNFTKSSGTSTNEFGTFNNNGFDGLRAILSGAAPWNVPSPGAVAVDLDNTSGGGPFSITQGINYAAAQVIDQGGTPDLLVMSSIAKNRLMNEQEGKQRTPGHQLIPGVMVDTVQTVAGDLPIIMVPGAANALGSYNRTSDGVSVQDIYILNMETICLRWIYSQDIQVLEIPAGVDGKLSRRFILFCFYGLQVADNGLFQSKLRIPNV